MRHAARRASAFGPALPALLLTAVAAGCGDGPTRPTPPGVASLPIVYSYFPTNSIVEGDLYLAAADGGAARRLTSLPGAELEAAWAPDGRRVAFTHLPPGAALGSVRVLATVDVASGAVTTLTPASMWGEGPAWSPDGGRLAFRYKDDAYSWGLAVVNADGTGLVRLAGARYATGSPVWSADGTRLTFLRQTGEGLAVVDVRAGTAAALDGAPSCGAVPRPSPDGARIAFTATCAPETRPGVYVANADGSGRRRLSGYAPWSGVAWAPDGRRLVFDAQRDGDPGDVFTVAVEGGAPVPVAAARGPAELWPDWRPGAP